MWARISAILFTATRRFSRRDDPRLRAVSGLTCQLAERFAADPHVQTHQRAVTDSRHARLFINDVASRTRSFHSIAHPPPGSRAWTAFRQDRRCARGDARPVLRSRSLTRIDVLKMDIQGGEAMALEGAAGLLAREGSPPDLSRSRVRPPVRRPGILFRCDRYP